MKQLILLAILGLPVDEWSDARKAAEAAVKNPDPSARESAATKLGAFDRKESVDLLLDLWAATTRFQRELQRIQAEKEQKADAMPIKKKFAEHKGGVITLNADEVKAKAEYDALLVEVRELESKIQAEDRVRGTIRTVLSKYSSPDAVKMLAAKLNLEADWSARAAAADALGGMNSAEAKEALRKQLPREKDPRAQMSIAESLGRLKDTEAVGVLADALKKAEDWPVRSTIVAALRQIGDPKAIEPLIEALKGAEGRVKDEINSALVAMTGVDKHGDHATWKDWYAGAKDALLGGTYAKPKDGPKEEGNATTFYGIPITSKRVCFVLDRSGSMAQKTQWKPEKKTESGSKGGDSGNEKIGDRRIDVAKYELRNAIKGLKPDVRFNVIFFDHNWQIWVENGLELASDNAKKRALDFVEKCEPAGATNIFDPLERAFQIQDVSKEAKKEKDADMALFKNGVDTIYLMSDGMPNNGKIQEPNAIIAKVVEINKTRKVKVHTIAVGDEIRPDFMKSLAEATGGTFVHRK